MDVLYKLYDSIKDFGYNLYDAENALRYLSFYGHTNKPFPSTVELAEGVDSFHRLVGKETTSELSPKDVALMGKPRCGCQDFIEGVCQGLAGGIAKWNKNKVTVSILEYLEEFSVALQDEITTNVCDTWQGVCGLAIEFTPNNLNADILISAGNGIGDNFDGPNGVLAWAYLPTGTDSQLNLKFDKAETWVEKNTQLGTLYGNVLAHEMGHSLGLSHSYIQGSLMYPYYNPLIAVPQLDDINSIQKRYGKPLTESSELIITNV